MKYHRIILSLAVASAAAAALAIDNVAEEVAWVVGDEPIYKSEIEEQYLALQQDRQTIDGDPYCVIPEMMAIEKLYLHQAELDTVEVSESMVQQAVDSRINYMISGLGSREKVEQMYNKSLPQIRQQFSTMIRNQYKIGEVQRNLTKDIKITPSDVRRYFYGLPADSVPYVPMQVEVQIITLNPVIPRENIEEEKALLRTLADRVNKGEADFGTLAVLYSQAPEGQRRGELGFVGRASLVPEFAAVAFNLNDPKKVSKIVETEYGYHIIQLIEKRGDRINVRHILRQPKVDAKDINDAKIRLDSLRTEILEKEGVSFGDVARYVSQDKDTRNSNGQMVNPQTGTTRFQMSQLAPEIALAVSKLEPGQVSPAFMMRDPRSSREKVAIVRLTNRIEAHKANLSDDYQQIKDMFENAERERILKNWLEKKIRETYVRIEDGWRNCDFTHKGWIKSL